MKSEVYNQSTCIVSSVAYQYYVEGRSRKEIADSMDLSPSTLSRLLKRAKEEGIIEFKIAEPYMTCHRLEEWIKHHFHLKNVVVVPELDRTEIDVKKAVALEGARYLQRIIKEDDVLGLAWGGTMYHLIQYLNPCRKMNASIVTMHGSIANCDEKLSVQSLVHRAAMAFGGNNIIMTENGLCENAQKLEKLKKTDQIKKIYELYDHITVSVSGLGSLYPEWDSLLATTNYIDDAERQLLGNQEAYSDIMLRFIDRTGKECDTPYRDRTLSIDLDVYRKIPLKIIVASGTQKVHSLSAVLAGGLADVAILDFKLAERLMNLDTI